MTAPRWEWRTFGATFGDTEARLAALPPTRLDDTEELYILSSRRRKHQGPGRETRRQATRGGERGWLEQWKPVANAEFPIGATDVASRLAALEVSVPSLDREAYTLDQLIDEVVAPRGDLLSVPVRKHRAHYVLEGCMAELDRRRSGSRATRTIAVEDENPAVVRSTVEALGLWSRPNVSFPTG